MQAQLTLRINLEISQELSGFPAIRVQEEMKLPPTDFMGMLPEKHRIKTCNF